MERVLKTCFLITVLTALSVLSSGCGSPLFETDTTSGSSSLLSEPFGPKDFFSTATELHVEVAYEPGAEPYTGTTSNGLNYWDILESNLSGLFSSRAMQPQIFIPKTLGAMTAISAQGKSSWSADDIYFLANSIRTQSPSSNSAAFIVLFLKGNFMQDGVVSSATLGVQIDNTSVIAVFKDVVKSSGGSTTVNVYIEQSTLVHEMGHALGLVNHGLAMQSAHEDSSHPHHCNNPNCVMYWQNEGGAALRAYVQKIILSGNLNLFGNECLTDAHSAAF